VLATDAPREIYLLNINSAIGPATEDYVKRGLRDAGLNNAELVIIKMDTPGGLDTAMRGMIKAIITSSVPVATFVAPGGARAASAGTYILYASHIAAMAPGTNLGAATPVSIGGGMPLPSPGAEEKDDKVKETQTAMTKKITSDAVAYIRSLAQLRGRNVEWAEKAVTEAASLPAEEALKLNVIDLIAKDISDLLNQLHGKKITVLEQEKILETKTLQITEIKPDWRSKFLAVITDPSVAYILLLIGVYGLFFEFANPGFVLPGVLGAIALLLALYAFQLLPISYAGLGLIILGIAFMVAEAFMPSFGILGIGGVIAFVAGSILLLDPETSGYSIAWELIIGMAIVNAAFFFFVIGMIVKLRRRPVVSGQEEVLESEGEVIEDFDGRGQVRIHGEIWQAESDEKLQQGQTVVVSELNGLIVKVKPK